MLPEYRTTTATPGKFRTRNNSLRRLVGKASVVQTFAKFLLSRHVEKHDVQATRQHPTAHAIAPITVISRWYQPSGVYEDAQSHTVDPTYILMLPSQNGPQRGPVFALKRSHVEIFLSRSAVLKWDRRRRLNAGTTLFLSDHLLSAIRR